MSFFNHVQLHKYDLTDKGVSQACRDEIIAEMGDAYVHLTDKQLDILADHMREEFKDYMRPLFAKCLRTHSSTTQYGKNIERNTTSL